MVMPGSIRGIGAHAGVIRFQLVGQEDANAFNERVHLAGIIFLQLAVKDHMNSINKNQPENNYQSLEADAAVEKIKELAEKTDTCFFCTGIEQGVAVKTRPMTVQEVDEQGNLWFLSAIDSHTNADIQHDGAVQLFFQGSSHSDFMTVYGQATVSTDKARIDKYWKPLLKTWFTEGKDDPRITVIKVSAESGYYWDNKHGDAVAFVKMVAGAIMGKTMDDSIEGKLTV